MSTPELLYDEKHALWHRRQDVEVIREVWTSYRRLPILMDDRCLDLGAHIGAASLFMLQKGAAEVLCVEPDADNCEILEKNLRGYPFTLRRAAVGREAGSVTLYVHPEKRCRNDTVKRVRGAVAVEVDCLAFQDLLTSFVPTVLKCDIEYQEHYLPELLNLPRTVRALQIEVHLRRGNGPETAFFRRNGRALLKSFKDQGFRLIYQNEKRAPYPPVEEDGAGFSRYATAHESTWERK